MEVGAFVLVPENSFVQNGSASPSTDSVAGDRPVPFWPVVGKNLLDEWIERVRRIGVQVLSIAHGSKAKSREVARSLAKGGVEQVLVISLKSYAEINLDEFVQFHRYRGASSTAAFDPEGPLGVEILNRASLIAEDEFQAGDPGDATKYRFSGYAKRLRSPQSYRDLVSDALARRCALVPQGSQIEENVWVGEEVQIAPSVRFSGPCFVGERTILRDFVTIGPFSSVENECRVDCGTAVEGSSILPNTFLGAGLSIRHSIIDGPRLEHLDSGTVVDLGVSALGRRFHPERAARRRRDRGPQARNWSGTGQSPFQFGWPARNGAVDVATPLPIDVNHV